MDRTALYTALRASSLRRRMLHSASNIVRHVVHSHDLSTPGNRGRHWIDGPTYDFGSTGRSGEEALRHRFRSAEFRPTDRKCAWSRALRFADRSKNEIHCRIPHRVAYFH